MLRFAEVTLSCEVVTAGTVVEVAGSMVLFLESDSVRPDSENRLWESIFGPSNDSSCRLNIWKRNKQFVFFVSGYVSQSVFVFLLYHIKLFYLGND